MFFFLPIAAPCGQLWSLHGQPDPAGPDDLFELKQVHSQCRLQLFAGTLGSSAVRAVQCQTQRRQKQEQAGEQGQVQTALGSVIDWNTKFEMLNLLLHNCLKQCKAEPYDMQKKHI